MAPRPFARFPRALVALLLLGGCLVLPPSVNGAQDEPIPETSPAPTTTVIVVRHAEKAEEPRDDPGLAREGRERARRLAYALSQSGVTAVYATQFRRTRETVEPVAAAHGLEVGTVDARDPAAAARAALGHPGGVVVVAGHSNTIGPIVEALGGGPVAPVPETDYDNLFAVTVTPGRPASVLRMSY